MSGLSLWKIDEAIEKLTQLREDPEITPDERSVIEDQITMYAQEQLPAKVDGMRGWIKLCQANEDAAKSEKVAAADTEKMWKNRREYVENICKEVMERREIKRLDGKVGYLTLKGNGGPAPMEPINEALIPDEYRKYRFDLSAPAWRALQVILTSSTAPAAAAIQRSLLHSSKAEVNTAAVRAGLEAGKEVPGARLATRGQHLEVK